MNLDIKAKQIFFLSLSFLCSLRRGRICIEYVLNVKMMTEKNTTRLLILMLMHAFGYKCN